MPTTVGPNTYGEENLVFGYDLGDVSNSYKGEPTTNIATLDLSNTSKWYSEGGTKVLQSETLDGYPVYQFRSSGSLIYISPIASNQVAATTNDVTLSAYFKNTGTSAQTVNVFLANDFGTDSNGNPNNRSIPADGKWYRQSWTRYAAANTYNQVEFRTFSDTLLISKPQVEYKKHVTPPVEGTRSVSGSLIDLTGNATINLSNVSFDSNGEMAFDGTSDYATIDHNTVMRDTDSLVIEAVFQVYSQFGYYGGIIGKGTSDADEEYFLGIYPSGNKIYFDVGQGSGPYVNASQTINSNQYYHVVAMHERAGGTSTCSIYVNGEFVSNTTSGATNSVNTNTTDITIGSRWSNGANSLNGDIPFLKMYNRILTASEIKANYNAIKGRFNI